MPEKAVKNGGLHMRTERKRLIIFILLSMALIAAFVLLLFPAAQPAAAEGETVSEAEDDALPAPRAVGEATVEKADGSLAEYATLSYALKAWEDGSTLILNQDVASSETITVSGDKTLDLNGHTLEGRSGRTLRVTAGTLTVTDSTNPQSGEIAGGGVRVEGGGAFILEGGYITDNTAEDGAGVFVSVGGFFTMTGGTIMDNTATGTGGGVCLLGGSSFTMTGGRIVDNKASEIGGGVFAAGSVSLSGGARISDNTVDGAAENLYLDAGQRIDASGLSGQVGITMPEAGAFASGTATGFVSDSPAYDVSPPNSSSEVTFSLVLSPLESVEARYLPTENIYPTTDLEVLRGGLTVTGTNANGAQYLSSALSYKLSLPEGIERLTVGSNEIVVTATGEGGERAETSFSVEVVAPSLTSIEAAFLQTETVYFDSSLDVLVDDLTVTGHFNDGYDRTLGRTPEETQALSGEDYITAYYTLSGDLAAHENGTVSVTATAGGSSANIVVAISRHVIDTADILVEDAVEVERKGAWAVSPEAFTPSLPAGVLSEVSLSGGGTVGNLSAGTYTVQITFYVTDEKNYELVGGPRTATLTVYYSSLTATNEDGTIFYTVEREGGIPLSWELVIKDVTEEVSSPKLEGGMESRQIFSVSLRDGGRIVTELDAPITVRIRIDGFFSNKDVTLFRLTDGGHIAVESTRDGDYLIFTTSSVQTQFCVAYNAGFGVYLALTIVFGVLCVGGAVLLVWYFKHKKKLDMTLPKQEE